MLRKIRERMESERGFTLIELLVVILIIGILAAIAIPAFLGQRDKAADSEAKSAVRNAASAMETHFVDAQNYNATAANLRAIEPSLNELIEGETDRLAVTGGANGYTLAVTAKSTGNTFSIVKNTNGTTDRTCTTSGNGGCPSSGDW